jgi:hypothetical protein
MNSQKRFGSSVLTRIFVVIDLDIDDSAAGKKDGDDTWNVICLCVAHASMFIGLYFQLFGRNPRNRSSTISWIDKEVATAKGFQSTSCRRNVLESIPQEANTVAAVAVSIAQSDPNGQEPANPRFRFENRYW